MNFRGDSAFSTWLYQIATNLARNRYWYWWRRKRDRSLSFDAPIGAECETTLAELIPAEQETPEDATVTQEFVGRVAECMEQLNEKHREILILRNVQNLAYEEIAEILSISVGTLKAALPAPAKACARNWGRNSSHERQPIHRPTESVHRPPDHRGGKPLNSKPRSSRTRSNTRSSVRTRSARPSTGSTARFIPRPSSCTRASAPVPPTSRPRLPAARHHRIV